MVPFDFVHNPVRELHPPAATPPSLLFAVVSTTNLVGHNIFISFVDRHKNTNFYRTCMATNKSTCNSGNTECRGNPPHKILWMSMSMIMSLKLPYWYHSRAASLSGTGSEPLRTYLQSRAVHDKNSSNQRSPQV